jgi:hypothetical protein
VRQGVTNGYSSRADVEVAIGEHAYLVDSAFYVPYVPSVTSIAWTMLLPCLPLWHGLCGALCLDYVTAYACFYDTSMLASIMHLLTTIRGVSSPVTNSRVSTSR